MVTTTGTQITIVFADAAEQPSPDPFRFLASRTTRITEQPPAGSHAFGLHASEGMESWEARLTADEAQHLIHLLEQAPTSEMHPGSASFDGIMYLLEVFRAGGTLSFQWMNEDWKYDKKNPREAWERVVAVVDYALELTKNARPANE